jgi:Arylsulfotransferase (ASST)
MSKATHLLIGVGILIFSTAAVWGQSGPANPGDGGPGGRNRPEQPRAKPGLAVNDPKALQGYTLLAPMQSNKTYLIDMEGRVVHTWKSDYTPALSAYLLENGELLRPAAQRQGGMQFGTGPGAGGRIQKIGWNDELIWDFEFTSDKQFPHHDVAALPNGNVVMIAWDKKTTEDATAAGRRPESVPNGLMVDSLVEIKPTGKTTGEVVWEWHLWDHLIQDHDKTKTNYGTVSAHPELVDVNFGQDVVGGIAATPDGANNLRSIGYVGNTPNPPNGRGPGGPGRGNPDWTHINSVAYHADLDQLVVSVHNFSEIWIIDHSTTTAEAASHKGGKSGAGGDLLYRWGNPRAYRAGTNVDQRLFAQHNASWIAKGLKGEGHLLVFNNGARRPDGTYSSVDEIELPVDSQGHYTRQPGLAFGPEKAVWSYSAPNKSDFFAMLISGAQRLPNGDTLVCSGPDGTVFEVGNENEVVWKYVNPERGNMPGGPGGRGGRGGRFGGIGGFFGFGQPARPGEILPAMLQDTLQLSGDQKKELESLQKSTDEKLDKLLNDEQRRQLKEMRDNLAGGGPGGFAGGPNGGPNGGPPGNGRQQNGGPPSGGNQNGAPGGPQNGPGGQGGFFGGFAGGPGFGSPGGGGPGGQSLFRSYRYTATYPGLVGKDLTPGKLLEELQPRDEPRPN